jgi:RHS repeat-associated protein
VTFDGIYSYLYDAKGRICAVASTPFAGMTAMTGYLYDGGGTRVAKGTITSWSCDAAVNGFHTINDYVLGLGGEQVTEMGTDTTVTDTGMTTGLTWQHANVWAGGKLLGTYDKDGLHFYFDDTLGTRRAQTDYAGVIEQSCSSLPFGDALNCVNPSQSTYFVSLIAPTEHHFTGKERDAESGNDYFEARYYSSAMGRFMSPDWAAKEEPVPYAKLDNPQSLNLYTYVGNNPLIHIDADGHCWPQSLCNAVNNAWNSAKQTLNQAGSYFYATGFKGTGDEIKVKAGPLKLEIGEKKGTEVTRHLNGEKEQKEIKQDAHLKAEIGPVSLGVERKQTGDGSKTEWSFSGEVKGIGGSGGQVGVSAEFCHGTCSSIEGGVEAGKALNDLIKNTPPPQPGSLDELMTIAPK